MEKLRLKPLIDLLTTAIAYVTLKQVLIYHSSNSLSHKEGEQKY